MTDSRKVLINSTAEVSNLRMTLKLTIQETFRDFNEAKIDELVREDLTELLTQACADACERYDDIYIGKCRFENAPINPPLVNLMKCFIHLNHNVQLQAFTDKLYPAYQAVINCVVGEIKHLNGNPHYDEKERMYVMPFAFNALSGDNILLLTTDYSHRE